MLETSAAAPRTLNGALRQNGTITLREIAEALNATLVGRGDFAVREIVHPLMARSADELALAVEPGALALLLKGSPLKAAVLSEGMTVPEGLLEGYIVVKRPRYALATLLEIFEKPVHAVGGVHPMAVVEASAQVHPTASIGAFAYVGEKAMIGENTIIMPHATVGAEARIGNDCLLHPGARVGERVMMGHRVILQHNASVGADGFSYVTPETGSIESAKAGGGAINAQNTAIVRINSIGTVVLEDDVEIGACACVDRATIGATIVKRGTKIDNLVMVGHNNTIGENCLMAGQVGIAGSCKIGDRVVLAGQVGIADHIKVGDDVIVMAQAGLNKDVPAKSVFWGTPALPFRETAQNIANVAKLKEMRRELRELKSRLAELEQHLEGAAKV